MLAKRLGDLGKESLVEQHSLAYEVLESYDDISGDLEEHRQKYLPDIAKGASSDESSLANLVLNPVHLKEGRNVLSEIVVSEALPRRQLYRIVSAWRNGDKKGFDASKDWIQRACEDVGISLVPLEKCFGRASWLHLLQMLPYTPTEQNKGVACG